MPTVLAATTVGTCACGPQHSLGTLSFAAYSAGADELVPTLCLRTGQLLEPTCVLELTHNLAFFFEQEFSPSLLQQALLALQPAVQLYAAAATAQEPARRDWPFLLDADVDAVAVWCERRQYPLRADGLQNLLEQALGGA